jgi:long-chain acyl-CoA synthetase
MTAAHRDGQTATPPARESLMDDRTIYRMLTETAARHDARTALSAKRGGAYQDLTYGEVLERVRALRRGLWHLGVRKGDRVALLSENRSEWAISDLACQSLGVVTVPIYSTLPAPQVQYVVADSAARVLIVSDKKQLAKALELRPNVRTLEHVIVMDGGAPEGVLSFEEACRIGAGSIVMDEELDGIAANVKPDDIATLIYTSGTTGEPKGAMLTHRALLHTGWAARRLVRLDENDVFLSFLPLCHIIERVGGHYLPLSIGAQIVYSEGVFAIGNEIASVKPTVFLCVPRLYESIQEKVMDTVAKAPEKRRRLFETALAVGTEVSERRLAGRFVGPFLALKHLVLEKLVLSKVREKVSGGRARFFVSGGAPLNPATAVFFEALGVRVLEGYGLTECPVISLNRPERPRPGTVGPTLDELEVKIAPDGEILSRGPSLMRGYFGKPQATEEAIDSEGWFHTGDIGELTPEGSLRITDRKKDIIVLANGKNVAPQPIEATLKQSAYIQEAVLIGDKQNAIVAIIVPAFDRLKAWAKDHELPTTDVAELARRPDVRKLFKEELDRASAGLADFEKVKKFTLAAQPFSIEGGELTPTLKVKRKVIAEKYADEIAQMVGKS